MKLRQRFLALLLALVPAPSLAANAFPIPGMPPPFSDPERCSPPLADILGTHRSLTSFSSFARLQTSTTALLADLTSNTTVLAPLNSAIERLPRKPWEDPREYEVLGAQAYDGSGGEHRANENLRKFVEAHLLTASPWYRNVRATTVAGKELWWEEKDGKRVIMPDRVEVEKVASQVANGEIWILTGVLKYA
ncbi:hypothetical protein DCS_06319 [Drechmeria coniospora]|uniref:FAS1 domain-containing protein n=1 Tax=Drechmeria coniospora TaxID=98403 RepID=A0A151GBE0_DRECN|nr:hypothetical protein DCS_06319 [Drechmeria coniospora]KYK54361.1 hypothetical protein DCS_06319 [Drechmeria coniospora]ODA77350.1 hypothetical protein RJ55_06978 [Drechmeria coniospora]